MIEWLIDKARKKNQIKWHRIGKERLFASFGSTWYIITQLWIWHGLKQHITETTLFSPSSLFLFPQFFRLLIDYKETGKMNADCGEPGRLCLGWGGVRVREGGGREVYEGEFFCVTVFAFESHFFRQALWTKFLDKLRWALFGFAGRVSRFNFFSWAPVHCDWLSCLRS